MKKGDRYISDSGLGAVVVKVTTKVITVELERKVLDKRTGEFKVEKRTREIPVDRWKYFEVGYRSTT
jgi:hypothetical protein